MHGFFNLLPPRIFVPRDQTQSESFSGKSKESGNERFLESITIFCGPGPCSKFFFPSSVHYYSGSWRLIKYLLVSVFSVLLFIVIFYSVIKSILQFPGLYALVTIFQCQLSTHRQTSFVKHWKTSFEKNFFCVGEYAEYGFDHGMFVACGIWCLADVSSVSPSSKVPHSKSCNSTRRTICIKL